MAFCSVCGAQMEDDAVFCSACGTQKDVQAPVQPQAPVYQQPVYQQPMYVKLKVPGRGFGIASMVLGIIGLVYALYLLLVTAIVVLYELNSYSGYYSYDSSVSSASVAGVVFAYLLYSVLSILAVSFAIPAKNRGYNNGISKSGLVMGVIGICLYVLCIVIVVASLA